MSWRAGIHGYVTQWNVLTGIVSRPHAPHLARPAKFERDCFSYKAATVEIWFMHRAAQKVGMGADLGLQIWPDDYGLAFAFTPPSAAWSLVCGIAEGRYDRCSAGYSMEVASTQRHGSVIFDNISQARLNEISICPQGACPGAVCWHSGNGRHALSPHAAALLPGWERSRSAHPRCIDGRLE